MGRRKWSKRKRLVVGVACALVLLAAAAVGFVLWLVRDLDKYGGMAIDDVSLESVPDGVYEGRFDGGRWSNRVLVTVRGHRIESLEVVDDVMFANKGAREEIFSRIIRAQSLQVDAVSGATVTCKAYLKAVEDALLRAGGLRR